MDREIHAPLPADLGARAGARDVVVVGASAGGVEALRSLVATFPRELPSSVFVVLHVPAEGTSFVPEILSRAGLLPAAHATDGEPVLPGRIYVAPPDRHLEVRADRVRVTTGPRRNRNRPSVDVLFRSAARAYGPRVAAAVLSGSLDDGTAGLVAVKRAGGETFVQEPDEALSPGMPSSALRNAPVDHVMPVAEIGAAIVRLAGKARAHPAAREPVPDAERGPPSVFTCPECSGTLWWEKELGIDRVACRVGHSYSEESFVADHDRAVERALWIAYRTLQERLSIQDRLSQQAKAQERPSEARAHEARRRSTADEVKALGEVVYRILDRGERA